MEPVNRRNGTGCQKNNNRWKERNMPVEELFQGMGSVLTPVTRILWFILSAIGYRKMFQKAGKSGWKAFVPFYKDFVCFQLAWNTKSFWLYLIASLLIYFMPGSDYLIAGLVVWVCMIICLVLAVKLNNRIAKSFGKNKGWGVLLFFFPFVVSLILGYGKVEYIGNTTIKTKNELNT